MATDSDAARSFSERLREAMIEKGYVSRRNKSGVDVSALARGAGTSYEMARRYVEGNAIPRPDVLDAIARWLRVPPASLAYGPATESGEVSLPDLERCIRAVEESQHLAGIKLEPDLVAKVVARLYAEATRGEKLSVSTIATLIKVLGRQ